MGGFGIVCGTRLALCVQQEANVYICGGQAQMVVRHANINTRYHQDSC